MRPLGLSDVRVFSLPRGILRDVQTVLQAGGTQGEERFVLLTGTRRKTGEFLIRSSSVPDQAAAAHKNGIAISVSGEELQRLNREWEERRETLAAQIHSHPTFPYHSPTDDRYPIVAVEGGLSIVVPLFGFTPFADLRACAVYRLIDAHWEWLPPRDVDGLVQLI